MQDTFIFGDIHNFTGAAQAAINVLKPPRIIWLGDLRGLSEWNLCLDCMKEYCGMFNDEGFFAVNLKTGVKTKLRLCSNEVF